MTSADSLARARIRADREIRRLNLTRPIGTTAFRLGSQLLVLWLMAGAGSALVWAFSLPVPGNLVGMLLLLLLLRARVIRPAQIADITALLLKHLTFLFVPLAVGVMSWTDLLSTSGAVLVVSLVGSAVVGLLTAGLVAQALDPRGA